MNNQNPLDSWRTGAAKSAITEFVEAVVGMDVPVEQRIAVFDADGTLWCEKPLPVEADFLLRRLAEQAAGDPDLQGRQPWKAAHDHDSTWFGQVITEHYAGDDTKTKVLLEGIVGTYAGIDVEDFEERAADFLHAAQHPSLGRGYLHTAYLPMVELLTYLEANGFSNFMVSGSGADFMRPVSTRMFGISPDRIIGSTTALEYTSRDTGGTILRKAALGFLDDGAQKRPIAAGTIMMPTARSVPSAWKPDTRLITSNARKIRCAGPPDLLTERR